MAKRFTDTCKWDKFKWSKLSMKMKLVWIYLVDKCDHAGIWEPRFDLLAFHIGEEVSKAEILDAYGDSVEWLPNGKLFLITFIEFQYKGELNAANKTHASVLRILSSNQIKQYSKPLASPCQGATLGAMVGAKDTDTDTDTDLDRDKDKDRRLEIAESVRHLFKCSTLP